jgi:hypothetical protein
MPCLQCSYFTGMILVFGPFLILFGLVWYGGMRKWYLGLLISFPPTGGVNRSLPPSHQRLSLRERNRNVHLFLAVERIP